MEYSEVSKLEQKLVTTLKEEYSFYQSLFILLDKQRDHIKYDRERKLVDLFGEIERLYSRIKESEDTISALRQENRKMFTLAASSPEIKRLAGSIITLVSKSLGLARENQDAVDQKHKAIQERLIELQKSSKIVSYLRTEAAEPYYVDKKH
jgi:hypothetical protein